jgi:hypothetical protein
MALSFKVVGGQLVTVDLCGKAVLSEASQQRIGRGHREINK